MCYYNLAAGVFKAALRLLQAEMLQRDLRCWDMLIQSRMRNGVILFSVRVSACFHNVHIGRQEVAPLNTRFKTSQEAANEGIRQNFGDVSCQYERVMDY